MPTPSIDEYAYEVNAGRFRSLTTGRYVAQVDIQVLMQGEIDAGFQRIQGMADALAIGRLNLEQFQNAMIDHLSYTHDALHMLGRGGVFAMDTSDFAMLTAIKESEFEYLDGFLADIANGKLSAAQVRARIGMYNEKCYGSFFEGVRQSSMAAGFDQERRVLNPAEHCNDCVALAAKGWQPINTLPRPTENSACQSNCKCTMEFRRQRRSKGQPRLQR